LSNHLGNVLVTVSDIKFQQDYNADNEVDIYTADIITAQDYYPFGMLMTGRTYGSNSYKFGFNGQELDNEVTGVTASHYTAEFWEYDARLGRRWNLDPKPDLSLSYYACFANNPIWFSDPLGDTVRTKAGDKQSALDLTEALKNEDFKKTYDKLNASDVIYEFAYHEKLEDKGGNITTDGKIINLNYTHLSKSVEQGELSTMFHEFEHGRQFEEGEIGFVKNSKGQWTADLQSYDILDEVKAMKFGSLALGGDQVIAKRKWDNPTKAAKYLNRMGPYKNWINSGSPIDGVPVLNITTNKHITIRTNNAFYRGPDWSK